MSNLLEANAQWSTRPSDERFASLHELYTHCATVQQACRSERYERQLVGAIDGELHLIQLNAGAVLTNWSFDQLCRRAHAPAAYLSTVPPSLAASCLNVSLARNQSPCEAFIHSNDRAVARAILSDRYTRIWDADVVRRLIQLSEHGWEPAHPTKKLADLRGDPRPALFASDRDLWCFMVNDQRRVNDGTDEGLARGFFVWNSEVGASVFGLMAFMYAYVCENFIVWGVQEVREVRIKHVGSADWLASHELETELRKYGEASAAEDEAIVARAKARLLGGNQEEVENAVTASSPILTRARVRTAYELAEMFEHLHGDPRSVWGMVQGLTRVSQALPYTDRRVDIDRAAGGLLAMVGA